MVISNKFDSDSTKCPLVTTRIVQLIILQDEERQAVRCPVSHALHRADGRQGERLRGRHDQEPRRGPRRRTRGPLQEDLDVRAVETGSKNVEMLSDFEYYGLIEVNEPCSRAPYPKISSLYLAQFSFSFFLSFVH